MFSFFFIYIYKKIKINLTKFNILLNNISMISFKILHIVLFIITSLMYFKITLPKCTTA